MDTKRTQEALILMHNHALAHEDLCLMHGVHLFLAVKGLKKILHGGSVFLQSPYASEACASFTTIISGFA